MARMSIERILLLLVLLIALGWGGYYLYQKHKQPHWIADLAKTYDPWGAANGQRGFIPLVLTCAKNDRIVYAYAKANLDLRTGQMKVFEYKLPDPGFACPK